MRIFYQILLYLFCIQGLFGSEFSFLVTKDERGDVRVGYLAMPRDKPIDNSTYLYVKYALESYVKDGVSFVLLDLDTPGGEVFSALRIGQELRKIDGEYGIPVVALVDDWALSAGALIAYSCRYIGVTSQGSMGAAEPVIVSSDGKMESASEKMVSALRAEFSKAAELYGRNPLIAEAMVDKDLVVVKRGKEIISLLDDAQIQVEDVVITTKGKLLTLEAKQMEEWNISNFFLQALGREPLSGKEILKEELFFSFPMQWISYENWKIDFFAFLSHPMVSSLLLIGFLIGLYGEVQHPGLGFSALLALFALSGMLLSSFAGQLIGWLEIIILLFGLSLVTLDLIVIGSWVLGGVGILIALGGLLTMLLPSLVGVSFSWDPKDWGIVLSEWIYRLSLFLCSVFISLIVSCLASRFLLCKSPITRRLVLKESENQKNDSVEFFPLVGSLGKSVSSLRPFGKVEIEGAFYEAETDGEFIQTGVWIEVLKVQNRHVKVREKR